MDKQPDYDPVFLNARREAVLIFLIWLAAMLWTVPYCYINGFTPPAAGEKVATVGGIPAWVFWGIGAPWMVANVLTIGFCLFIMKDDDLGRADDEPDAASIQSRPADSGASV